MKHRLAILLLLAAVPLLALAVGSGGTASAPLPVPVLDADLRLPLGNPLLSVATDAPPASDGLVEEGWSQAPALTLPLHYGLHGSEPAGTVQLRSMHDDERVYFLARWRSDVPGGDPAAWRNLLTVHWRLAEQDLVSGESTGSEGLACKVACHTVTADGRGRLIGMRNETIPPGLDEDLPSGGGWNQREWIIEWSRPRVSQNPYDQPMTDATQGYPFFVKLFQALDDAPDPVSDLHELRLGQ